MRSLQSCHDSPGNIQSDKSICPEGTLIGHYNGFGVTSGVAGEAPGTMDCGFQELNERNRDLS
jgi:hypothetical protein